MHLKVLLCSYQYVFTHFVQYSEHTIDTVVVVMLLYIILVL